jgi:hypothetical protein
MELEYIAWDPLPVIALMVLPGLVTDVQQLVQQAGLKLLTEV